MRTKRVVTPFVLRLRRASTAILIGASVMLWSGLAQAQTPASVEAYWTPERMRAAQAMPLPLAEVTGLGTAVMLEHSAASAAWDEFRPAAAARSGATETQLDEDDDSAAAGQSGAIGGQMISSRGYPFTTRRVWPGSTVNSSPFYRAGKLFFTTATGNFVCSGAIISRRLVLTAAHCVHTRSPARYHTNLLFVPAYNGAASNPAPYCAWTARSPRTTSNWRASSGYPALDDFAIIEINDRSCNGATRSIGNYLGWFGWTTMRLLGNNITQLGYPGNLDSGNRMQITQSNVYRRSSTAGEIGSAQGGGSSGGPWVQNFGVRPAGQVDIGGSGWVGYNRIVGVTSYGAVAHNSNQYSGANQLNSRFVTLWNAACARLAGNC